MNRRTAVIVFALSIVAVVVLVSGTNGATRTSNEAMATNPTTDFLNHPFAFTNTTARNPLALVRKGLRAGKDFMVRKQGRRSVGATRADGRTGSLGKRKGRGTPGSRSASRTPSSSNQSTLNWKGWPRDILPQVGYLVTDYGNGKVGNCTATVLTKTLVITAGHCVHHPVAGSAQALAFVPGMTWDNLDVDPPTFKKPWGVWSTGSKNWWVPQGWLDSFDPGLDFALVEFGPQPGWLSDTTGSFVAQWNLKYQRVRHYIVGYPGDGQWLTRDYAYGLGQYACDATYVGQQEQVGSGWLVWSACTMNRGSSGGPWFLQLTNNNWVIGAVTSQCWGGQRTETTYCIPTSEYSRGLYLDDNFATFWNGVQPLLHWR